MTAAPGGEALVLRRRRRWAVEHLLQEATTALLVVLAGAVILGSTPLDYQYLRWLVESVAGIVALVTVPPFVLRLVPGRRVSVVLASDGICNGLPGPGRIPWSDVAGLQAVGRLAGRHVRLTRRSGPAVKLYAPYGSGWLPDPAFRRETAALQQWAARHGVETEPAGRQRRWPATAIAMAILAVLTTAGIRAADRGVIWPWTPTASRVTAACPALQAAGLDAFWPAATRTLERDEQDRLDIGEYSYCWWVSRLGRTQDAPYIRLSAVLRRHSAYAMFSPIAIAINGYNSDRTAESSPQPVPGLGDEAFISSADDEVLVEARRANVTVSIGVDLDLRRPEVTAHRHEAEDAALTAAVLADIRLGEGTAR
jgi:hypothetical protein